MTEYPYILNTGRLKSFLELIPRIGVPDRITVQTLPRLGYTSENDRPIVKILKFIGFIDADGVPAQDYMNFRDAGTAGVVMAKAIRRAYCELFNVYPDAYKRDDETLKTSSGPLPGQANRWLSAWLTLSRRYAAMQTLKLSLKKLWKQLPRLWNLERRQKASL